MTGRLNNFWYFLTDSPTVFIFVHGIFSDSRACWTSKRAGAGGEQTYWPDLVAKDSRFDSPAIYMAGFHTRPNARDYDLHQVAREVRDALTIRDSAGNPPPIDRDNLVFICHSTGGIVTRYLLEGERDLFRDKRIGLLLIASPSQGSVYASLFSGYFRILRQQLALQLQWKGELKQLDGRFRRLVANQNLHIRGWEASEHHMVGPRWLKIPWLPRVVEPESAALYFGPPKILAETDHFSAVKPTSFDHPAHEMLVKVFSEFQEFVQFVETPRHDQEACNVPPAKRPLLPKPAVAKSPVVNYPYGHPYPQRADALERLAASLPMRGQLMECLGPPGSLKSAMIDDVASRLAGVRRIVRIDVHHEDSIDTFEEKLIRHGLGGDGREGLSFDEFLDSAPPLFILVDAFHCYFTNSLSTKSEAIRIWPQRLRSLTVGKPHVVVLCGSLSPYHLYRGFRLRQGLEVGSWNLHPIPLTLRPDLDVWYEQLAKNNHALSRAEIERLGNLAEGQPGVLIVALDALRFGSSAEASVAAAHKSIAGEIMFAAPPCCRELLMGVSANAPVARDSVDRDCRDPLVTAGFLIDSPEGLRLAVPAWGASWRRVQG